MKRKLFLLATAFLGLIFSLFFLSTQILAIPNPAAVFCAESGYKSETRTDSKGNQYGVCVDSKGIACGQWDYYCNCNPEGIGCSPNESKCNLACQELSCSKAGESAFVSGCCKELKEIVPIRIYDDNCQETGLTGWTYICSDCGNRICEKWENSCNCAQDCSEEAKNTISTTIETKKAKLLFIFPVAFTIEIKIDLATGKVISVKKPWWSFLAW